MSELNLVLLGPPGSGKGTQGERLQEDFQLPYFATGDILRTAVAEGTDLGKEADEYMQRGDLAPDEIVVGIIVERIATAEAADGFILDGFPRTLRQGEALDEALKGAGRLLTAVLLFDVNNEEVTRRLGGRRTCTDNGHVFHVDFNAPKTEGICDIDGSELIIRKDDRPEVIEKRLSNYHDLTKPLVGYYEQSGVLRHVEGCKPPDEVGADIRGLLATLRMEEDA